MINQLLKEIQSQPIRTEVHFYMDVYLIPDARTRMVWQTLYNQALYQHDTSNEFEMIRISKNKLAVEAGVERAHTLPSCLQKLTKLELIKINADGIKINLKSYCKMLQFISNLSNTAVQQKFIESFQSDGITAYHKQVAIKRAAMQYRKRK